MLVGETENDVARLDERHKALSSRLDDYRSDLKGDIEDLKTKISAVAANQRWVALAVIAAVIAQAMRNLMAAGGL